MGELKTIPYAMLQTWYILVEKWWKTMMTIWQKGLTLRCASVTSYSVGMTKISILK